ncbi:serine/threonine-protein phosphatase [Brachyspira pilosicoli]|uniref:Serine/threonine-protein phosphatase n=2 Tax=Brachyspira pilosicoli TaxID=52584 RepID=A0A5C8F8K1_BRAPL|nr:serine/threonine-protein phosphatase [Brachyspira pilosicoli]
MMKQKVLILLKIALVAFFLLFLILNITSIVYYNTKIVFIVLLVLFLLFSISFFIVYFFVQNSTSNYKEILETNDNGITHRFSNINSAILNDYQNAIKKLKEKNMYVLGRYDVLDNIRKKYKKDMKNAKKIQRSMLPKKMPKNEYLSSYSFYNPVEIIGGDFFDYVYLNNDASEILFIISDVSGHGIDAAIITAVIKTAFRDLSKNFISVKSLLHDINDTLINMMPSGYYSTMIVAKIDLKNRVLTYSNASHTPLLAVRNNGIKEYRNGGTIIGLFPSAYFHEEDIELNNGDIFLFFTDGIIEASKSKNKYDVYGIDRLKDMFRGNSNYSAETIIENIKRDFYEYLDYRSPDDDCSMVIFKVNY